MDKFRTVSRFALFFLVTALASYAVAAEKATPSGKVTMSTTSIAAGVGVSWGDGMADPQREDLSLHNRRSIAG